MSSALTGVLGTRLGQAVAAAAAGTLIPVPARAGGAADPPGPPAARPGRGAGDVIGAQ